MIPVGYGNCELLCDFVDFITFNDFTQFNHVSNENNKILDLLLCNSQRIRVRECVQPIRQTDKYHPALEIEFQVQAEAPKVKGKPKRFNFYKGDYQALNDSLGSIDWRAKLGHCDSVNEMLSVFYNDVYECMKSHIPETKSCKGSYPIWFSPQLIYMLKQKSKRHKKYKKFGNPLDKIEFEYLRNDISKMIKECYKNYIDSIERKIKENSKYFWTHVKNLRKNSSSYPSTMTLNNTIISDPESIPDLFATHFSSVFEVDDDSVNTTDDVGISMDNTERLDLIDSFEFDPIEIEKKLKKLDITKSVGPDNIHPLLLVNCARNFALPLSLLYNQSLKTGTFPDAWKQARVVPIYKSGKRECVANYRPVSILSTISKVFESMIHSVLYRHIHKYLISDQYGFVKNRSTNTNLVLFASELMESVDQGFQVDAVYTDFSKAFDKVNHRILLRKLYTFGLSGNLLEWCDSYLKNRPSQVVIDGVQSTPFIALSGVPQGSVLGPLFFNIFINDIAKVIKHSKIYMFADDLKLTKIVSSDEESKNLQKDIDGLQEWCNKNKMYLNGKKCKHIKFTKKRNKMVTEYSVAGSKLEEVTTIRDLGVTMDCQLRFTDHIDNIVKNANKSLGFILRSSKGFKNPSTVILLYNSYVRSQLEYCSSVWNPNYNIHINRIEKVQKKFIRSVAYKFGVSNRLKTYIERLQHFRLHSLSKRRAILDMSYLHKLLNGHIDSPTLLSKLQFNVPNRVPRHPGGLFKKKFCRTTMGRNSPIVRLSRMYNDLCKRIFSLDIHSQTLPRFLSLLREDDLL